MTAIDDEALARLRSLLAKATPLPILGWVLERSPDSLSVDSHK